MEENKTQEPVQPEKESLLDKAKKLFRKAEDYVENKIEDIKESGVKEKLEAFADKVEDKAEDTVAKMKEFGKKAATKTADKLEDIAENIKKKTGDEEKPESV
jgi:predicted metal-dependent hydrolase